MNVLVPTEEEQSVSVSICEHTFPATRNPTVYGVPTFQVWSTYSARAICRQSVRFGTVRHFPLTCALVLTEWTSGGCPRSELHLFKLATHNSRAVGYMNPWEVVRA